MPIYHLALRSDWDAAQDAGEYRVSTLGQTLEDVGFIHASYRGQLPGTAEFYRDATRTLCVLVIDDDAVRAAGVRVVDEDPGNGQLFPHIYGALDVAWVDEVLPAGFGEDGVFRVSEAE